jgi:hypothetical protein
MKPPPNDNDFVLEREILAMLIIRESAKELIGTIARSSGDGRAGVSPRLPENSTDTLPDRQHVV